MFYNMIKISCSDSHTNETHLWPGEQSLKSSKKKKKKCNIIKKVKHFFFLNYKQIYYKVTTLLTLMPMPVTSYIV
jgi:hypothetical protein